MPEYIKLLTAKEFREASGLSRYQLDDRMRKKLIRPIKVSAKKLWFLPPRLQSIIDASFKTAQD